MPQISQSKRTRSTRRMRQRRFDIRVLHEHPSQMLAQLWILRLLVDFEGWRNLFADKSINEELVLGSIGLSGAIGHRQFDNIGVGGRKLLPLLRRRYAELLDQEPALDVTLQDNLACIGKALRLADVDLEVLAFAVIHNAYKPLMECTDGFADLHSDQVATLVAGALGLRVHAVRRSLAPDSVLSRSGILVLNRNLGLSRLVHKLELLDAFSERLMEPHSDALQVLRGYFHASPPAALSVDDFRFMADDVYLAREYLGRSVKQALSGSNILFYGLPGTGKTELARALADALGVDLFEISTENEIGEPLTGSQRFNAFQLAQTVLSSRQDVFILFDEVEDVFTPDAATLFGAPPSGERRKAWVNQRLEHNPVPAVWVSNDIDILDRAYLRRFDLIVKFEPPPRATRYRILSDSLGGLAVSRQWLEQAAKHRDVVPALVSRAAKVVSLIAQGEGDAAKAEKHLQRVIGNTLEAMGGDAALVTESAGELTYRLDVLNPDQDLEPLVQGMRREQEGRVCLYGAPGTGKSEFARHAAEVMGRPLLVKRASDILGPYVGMTERKIAQMFREAELEQAVLLLDEADSLLRDRRAAGQGFEVTQVNELLTQMERFRGVFICSTNLIDALDEAAMRRFDLKIRFDWMRPDQAWTLFRQVIKDHGGRLPAMNSPYRSHLRKLDRLAPGDFATVVRRCRVLGGQLSPARLYQGLADETGFKRPDDGRGIGFTAVI